MKLIRSESGFTIAEQLFTLILVGLLGIVVAAGIGVATRTYTDVRDVADTHSVLNNAVTMVSDELRYASGIAPVTGGTPDGSTSATLSSGIMPANPYGSTAYYAFDSVGDNARIVLVNSQKNIETQTIVPFGVLIDETSDAMTQYNVVPEDADPTKNAPLVRSADGMDITVQLESLSYDPAKKLWSATIAAYKNPVWSGNAITSWSYKAEADLTVRALNG